MVFVKGILIFIEVVVSLLLVGAILIQRTKDEGLGLAFGGGVGESLFGSRTGNVLTKITIILGIVFLANTLALSLAISRTNGTGSIVRSRAAPAATPQPMPAPASAPAAAPAQPAATPAPTPAPAGASGAE